MQAGLKPRLQALTARALRRLPIVGGLYRLADGFVSVLDRKAADIGAMSPVWCFFGGAGGGAVLALAPGAEPIDIDGSRSACPRGWPAAALPRHTVRGHPIEVGLGLGIYLRLSAPSRVGRSRRRAGHLRLSSTSTDGAK